ncbi:MAG: hypothetical protein RH917_05685 [Lacipirellulaceae bacterium]
MILRISLLLIAVCPATCHGQSVPLCPSVLLINKPHHRSGIEQLRKVAKLGFQEVNLVVSLRCEIDSEGRVLSYGFVRKGRYRSLSDDILNSFRAELLAICREAKRLGLRLSLLPHLDSAGENYDWRNHYDFDPLRFYKGFSYDQAIIESLLLALSRSGYDEEEVHFALSGEMGRSLFLYPDSYLAILKQMRQEQRLKNVRIGVSLNFSEVDGKAEPSHSAQVQAFIQQCDFLGFSHYRPFEPPARATHFAASKANFLRELKEKRVQVPKSMPLHLSEVALGGGSADSPVAASTIDAAATPWEGSADPRLNPWEQPELRELRTNYHEALLDYLSDPMIAKKVSDNPITAAYLWCEGSWDPLDIAEDGFADEVITRLIQEHNRGKFRSVLSEPK